MDERFIDVNLVKGTQQSAEKYFHNLEKHEFNHKASEVAAVPFLEYLISLTKNNENFKSTYGRACCFLSFYYQKIREKKVTYLPETEQLLKEDKLFDKELHYAREAANAGYLTGLYLIGLIDPCKALKIYMREADTYLESLSLEQKTTKLQTFPELAKMKEFRKLFLPSKKPHNTTEKILMDFARIEEVILGNDSIENHVQLIEKEDEIIKNIKKFIFDTQLRGNPIEGYFFNDHRTNVFFADHCFLRKSVLARIESYYYGALLLANYMYEPFVIENQRNRDALRNSIHGHYNQAIQDIGTRNAVDINRILRRFLRIFQEHFRALRQNTRIHVAPADLEDGRLRESLIEAEALSNWIRESKITVTISNIPGNQNYTIVQFDIPVLSRTSEQYAELTRFQQNPYWFTKLPYWEQLFWKDISADIQNAQDISCVLFTQPSTIRNYPDLPFYMHHGILIFDQQNQTLLRKAVRCRSSIVSPYNLKENRAERQRLTKQNIYQLVSNELPIALIRELRTFMRHRNGPIVVPVLYQTLLSNLKIDGVGENQMLRDKMEEFEEFKETFSALLSGENRQIELVFINTNYAINNADEAKPLGKVLGNPINNAGSIKSIIYSVKRYLSSIEEKARMLNIQNQYVQHFGQLLIALGNLENCEFNANFYQQVKNNIIAVIDALLIAGVGELETKIKFVLQIFKNYLQLQCILQADPQLAKNLFIAALESSLITAVGGLVFSSCKSGKDRNALLQISVDAIEIHFILHGSIPDFTQATNDYNTILTCLFESGHQQIMASLNAQGAVGLKSVQEVLPGNVFNMLQRIVYYDKKTGYRETVYTRNTQSANLNRLDMRDPKFIDYPNPLDSPQTNVLQTFSFRGRVRATRLQGIFPDNVFTAYVPAAPNNNIGNANSPVGLSSITSFLYNSPISQPISMAPTSTAGTPPTLNSTTPPALN